MTTAQIAAGFEKVVETFDDGAAAFGSGGGAFAAYIDGEPVVDVWTGAARPGEPWRGSTLAVLMSTTKGLATLCAQILVDRGQLDVEVPVATYWPEFAQAGKEAVLVRHVLTHTAGVLDVGTLTARLTADGDGWVDYDAIATALAASAPSWPAGTRFGYHAMSYGWLVGELVRRITGQTIGTFFRVELAEPFGIDAFIGTPQSEQGRVAYVIDRLTDNLPRPARAVYPLLRRRLWSPRTLLGQSYLARGDGAIIDSAEALFNRGPGLEAEIPSGGGTATAHALARVYAMLACRGEVDGVRIVSEECVERFAAEVIRMPDEALRRVLPGVGRLIAGPVGRSLGYVINPANRGELPRFGPNPRAFGHDGAGGQIAFADLDNRISVGFVRNELRSSSALSTKLIAALYECAAA